MNQIKGRQKDKIVSLQALRGIAFIAIFLSHVDILHSGNWGVSVFFCMSGFVMYYTYCDRKFCDKKVDIKTSLSFSINKVKKLYPLHLLTLFAMLLLTLAYEVIKRYPLEIILTDTVNRDTISSLLLMQVWVPRAYFSLNTPSWYLSACLVIYAIFPIICQIINKYKKENRATLAIILTFMLQLTLSVIAGRLLKSEDLIHWLTYINPIYRLGDFL